MAAIRSPAVAGAFYPADPDELQAMIQNFLAKVEEPHPIYPQRRDFLRGAEERAAGTYMKYVRTASDDGNKVENSFAKGIPKAIIAPHAGYIYSGLTAAHAYACLKQKNAIRRVVLFGPSHRYPINAIAAPSVDFFETPLGTIPIDKEIIQKALKLPQVVVSDEAHAKEHSLEVQLPFLQMLLKNFNIAPFVVGFTTPELIAEVMESVWGEKETLIVISSDLSHYMDYQTAQSIDRQTANHILNLQPQAIDTHDACGGFPIRGLLNVAKKKGLKPALIDLRNSGDTAGPKTQVVGYGAFHFNEL